VTDQSNGFALKRTLEQECATAQLLLETLEQEQAALASNDIEKLTALTPRKSELSAKLEQQYSEHSRLLPAASTSADLEKYINHFEAPLQQELRQLLSKLKSILPACKRQNDINGTVLNVNLQNSQRISQILRGQDSRNVTYDQSGHVSG
jgi:flagellar biosynthesis protein FlgN